MDQVLQIVGALMVLVAFAAAQFRLLDARSYPYLLLNVVGSAVLAVLAFEERQWGFLLLEGVWSLVSFAGLLARVRGQRSAPSSSGGSADVVRSRPRSDQLPSSTSR